MKHARALVLLAVLTMTVRAHAEPPAPPAAAAPHAEGRGAARRARGAHPARKVRRLEAAEVAEAIAAVTSANPLPRGATLVSVRARATEVPTDFARVTVDLPAMPRRAGPVTVRAVVSFVDAGGAVLVKEVVPLELSMPPEAALPEIPRGAPITLVIRRGLVEVTVNGVAAVDGDVGSILPVTIRPSGRVVRARAVDTGHAVLVEGP